MSTPLMNLPDAPVSAAPISANAVTLAFVIGLTGMQSLLLTSLVAVPMLLAFGAGYGNFALVALALIIAIAATLALLVVACWMESKDPAPMPATVLVGVAGVVALTFTVWILFVASSDFSARCQRFENLQQRHYRSLVGLPCSAGLTLTIFGSIPLTLAAVVLLSCSVRQLTFGSRRRYASLTIPMEEKPMRASSQRSSKCVDLNNCSMFPAYAAAVAIGVLLVGIWPVYYTSSEQIMPSHVHNGTCPVGAPFFESPRNSDLPCCRWYRESTCVNVNGLYAAQQCHGHSARLPPGSPMPSCDVCKSVRANRGIILADSRYCDSVTLYKGFPCHWKSSRCYRMIGVLQCAAFSPNAASFMTATAAGGWSPSVALCPSYCNDLFNQCFPYIPSEYIPANSNATAWCSALPSMSVGAVGQCFSSAANVSASALISGLALVAALLVL